MQKVTTVRLKWVDAAKGLGMLAIVLGHVLRGEGVLSHMVYVFHVSLFVFLSGYLSLPEQRRGLGSRARRLLIPYVVFGLISIFIYAFLGRYAGTMLGEDQQYTFLENIGWFAYGYTFSNLPLWFLPCLFVTEIFLRLSVRAWEWGRNKGTLVGTLCWVLPFLVSGGLLWIYFNRLHFLWPWSLQSAICLFPFAWAGYSVKKLSAMKLLPIAKVVAGGILTVTGLALGILNNKMIQYVALDLGNWMIFYVAAFLSVAGICLCLSEIGGCKPLELVGRHSMPILLMHKFPVLFFQVLCPGFKNWLKSGSVLWSCIATVLSVAMCIAVGKLIQKILPEALGLRRSKENREGA